MKGIQLDRDHWSYCNHDVSRQNATEANRPEEILVLLYHIHTDSECSKTDEFL